MLPNSQRWTTSDTQKLRDLVAAGKTRAEIRAAFPRRRASNIAGKMHLLGLRTKWGRAPLSVERRRKIGIRVGRTQELSSEVQERVLDIAAKRGLTVMGAIDLLLRGPL